MRIAILHTRLSGYMAACLREFKRRSGAELLLYAWPSQPDAPFDGSHFADLGEVRDRREHSDAEIGEAVHAFCPVAILVSGWADKGYVQVCKAMRKQGIPVISGCDTQWKGTMRQHAAGWTSRFHVQKAIDVLWVTGERQATLARALGYRGEKLWDGYYACDWARFERGNAENLKTETLRKEKEKPYFLYVGRYVDVKGIDVFVEAYRLYRERVEQPWRLKCAGTGPLKGELLAAGAEDLGFVQPDALPAVMAQASAFVLPSRFEPWGVVVQEAAASGLPLILSDACGAGVHLLRDQFNGLKFPAGNAVKLAERMERFSAMSYCVRAVWGQNSFELSKQYTPERWAETLLIGLDRIRE